jgi:hypothetical protein
MGIFFNTRELPYRKVARVATAIVATVPWYPSCPISVEYALKVINRKKSNGCWIAVFNCTLVVDIFELAKISNLNNLNQG